MPGPYNADTTANVIVHDLASQIAGKVVLTTGVSPGGLGAVFVTQIAAAGPALLILAGRSPSKTQAMVEAVTKTNPRVKTRTLQLDLESLEKVRRAAAEVDSWANVPAIDVLVNNAGIMACDYGKTEDGIERQFAVGHVGPFLFTNLIMKKLMKANAPRVVSVASDGHRLSAMRWPDIGFSDGKLYNKWRAYGQAKTANVLFATALAAKLGQKGLTSVSLHPGVIMTHLGDHLDWDVDYQGLQKLDKELGNKEGFTSGSGFTPKSIECGVATHVYAAFELSLKGHNGAYLQDGHIANPYIDTIKPYAKDPVEADRLWKLSENLVGQTFAY